MCDVDNQRKELRGTSEVFGVYEMLVYERQLCHEQRLVRIIH